ncbi:MAG: LytR family transcriptional regulator [Actinobacteria bacterium]|nr:MAG: LytR family transcriptional regulator [Actinomycetota bacterium]
MLPVEHALRSPSSHPWRTIAVVAAGIATLELLALVVTATALVAKPVAKHARAAAAKHASTPTAKVPVRPLLARRLVTVTVLNGNGVAGAAADTASRVRARGYKTRKVGNAPRSGYGRSVVIYRAGFRPEALRLGRDLGIALVSPLDGLRASNLAGAKLAVVLGG